MLFADNLPKEDNSTGQFYVRGIAFHQSWFFWNGSTESVAEIARSEDKGYLQTIDDTANIGFSRAIDVVGKSHIFAHYHEYGGRRPPPITHQGINDAFVEKGSFVHYFYRKRWLKLQGAD